MFMDSDKNDDGMLDFEEFCSFMRLCEKFSKDVYKCEYNLSEEQFKSRFAYMRLEGKEGVTIIDVSTIVDMKETWFKSFEK